MAKDKTTIRFWLRTDRLNGEGTAPLHLVYQIKGQRKYYAIPNVKLLPINWDVKEQQAIYVDKRKTKKSDTQVNLELLLTGSEVEEINNKLVGAITDIRNVEQRFKLDKTTFSASMVIEALKEMKQPETKKDKPGLNIVDFIDRFSKETTVHKPGTIKNYIGLKNHLIRFQERNKQKITFANVDVSMIKRIHNFFLEEYVIITKNGKNKAIQINNITAAKLLDTLKTLIRKAEDEYDIEVNPKYKKYKNPFPRRDSDLEVIALTEDELLAIIHLDLSKEISLDKSRDIFLFSIGTSLRYGDLAQFDWPHVKKDDVIRMPSSDKNGKNIEIPLNAITKAILNKYAGMPKPLPTTARSKLISTQKLDDNIKEICKLAGIDTPVEKVREYGIKKISKTYKKYELLSIHTGRKTFTTLSFEKDIAIQDVMALTTHSSFKALKRYINVTKERRKTAMAKGWGEIPNSNLKAV